MEKACVNCKYYERVDEYANPHKPVMHYCNRWYKTVEFVEYDLIRGGREIHYVGRLHCETQRDTMFLSPIYFLIRLYGKYWPCCKSGRNFEPK